MVGLLAFDTSTAEKREDNEIVELLLTLGVDLPVAMARPAQASAPSTRC